MQYFEQVETKISENMLGKIDIFIQLEHLNNPYNMLL